METLSVHLMYAIQGTTVEIIATNLVQTVFFAVSLIPFIAELLFLWTSSHEEGDSRVKTTVVCG